MKRPSLPEQRQDEDALYDPKDRAEKLLDRRLMAQDFNRQVAEFRASAALPNGYSTLGNPVTNLSPGASLHSRERVAPSDRGAIR